MFSATGDILLAANVSMLFARRRSGRTRSEIREMAWLGSVFIAVGAAFTIFAPAIKKRDDRRRATTRIRAGFPHVASIVIFGLMLIVIGIVTLSASG